MVCIQNHDQVGNRMMGDRLASLVDMDKLKLGAACMLLSPYTPLLFMGEEYGETKPFPYFIHHSDEELVEAVRKGRREEFSSFAWKQEPPDPQGEETFRSAVIEPQRNELFVFYQDLIRLRRQFGLNAGKNDERDVFAIDDARTILVNRLGSCAIYCFSDKPVRVELPVPRGEYKVVLNTSKQGMPDMISSPGAVTLELAPWAAVLLVSA